MADQKPTHIPAEGEGTPTLPGDTDLTPKQGQEGDPKPGDDDFVPAATHPA